MADVPNSYKDPYWQNLASNTESKLNLPTGALTSILNNGERSNNDQVSGAGAKTPFQIIPATRDAAIKKWGIDPYLSPDNAAEVAGLLYKDSLDRNKGNIALATAEYHGGTDRSNWGPLTRNYVQRVTQGMQQSQSTQSAPTSASVGNTGSSTFDKVMAAQPKPSANISAVYNAYQSGQMTPDEAKQFESDVSSGLVMLPRGASLNASASPDSPQSAPQSTASAQTNGSTVLPQAVADAYSSGQMPRQDMIDLERDVKNGVASLPPGVQLQKTEPLGFLGGVKEAITGTERQTPITQGLPDWASMPELNSASMASMKTGIGTMLSNPAETVQVIKSNFPGVQVSQDEKGNYLLQSSIDGKQYAIKPGFQVSDIPRAIGGALAFTSAGRAESVVGAGLKSAATQAAIEGSQAATGGSFDPKEVLVAGALGAAAPAAVNAVRAVAQPARQILNNVLGRTAPEAQAVAGAADNVAGAAQASPAAAAMAPEAQALAPAAPVVQAAEQAAPVVVKAADAVAPMSSQELGATARKAAEGGFGSNKAMTTLAEQAAPDAKTVEAAKRLGIEDYLQPDHVTTNQAYRELAQAVKSVPGSSARVGEMEGLSSVAKRADDLITDIGGSHDNSQLSQSIKSSLQSTTGELEQRANALYKQLREGIPPQTEAPAPAVLQFIDQRAKDLGGPQNLTSMEKMILSKLSPKEVPAPVPEIPAGSKMTAAEYNAMQAAPKTVTQQPTYTLLDDVRKDVGAAARMAGPFKDADTGLAKKLYSLIGNDQQSIATSAGMGDTFTAAKQAVAVRKGMENDLVSLFGKNLDGSIVGNLSGAVKSLPSGDTSKFINLIKTIPENMRQETVANGLLTAFGKNARNGQMNFGTYAKWYEGLLRNKQAYTAVMSNLPPEARKQLSDLYRVSKGISMATRERITTGRIQAVTEELKGADSLMSGIYSVARRASAGLATEAITTPLGMPGAGVSAAIASALTKGKPNALKAADALISSPEFSQAVKEAAQGSQKQAVARIAYSKPFTKFVRAVGNPKDMSNRERWITQALQADSSNNQTSSQK